MSAETKPPRDSLMPVLIVLGLGVALMVGVISITGPAGLFIVLAISGVLGFAALHYVLWGWWLTKRIRDAEEEDRDARGDDTPR